MKYLIRFIIWTFYLLGKVFWYLIYNFFSVIWNFSFDTIRYDYILNSKFYFNKTDLKGKWYYTTYYDALKNKKKYL